MYKIEFDVYCRYIIEIDTDDGAEAYRLAREKANIVNTGELEKVSVHLYSAQNNDNEICYFED